MSITKSEVMAETAVTDNFPDELPPTDTLPKAEAILTNVFSKNSLDSNKLIPLSKNILSLSRQETKLASPALQPKRRVIPFIIRLFLNKLFVFLIRLLGKRVTPDAMKHLKRVFPISEPLLLHSQRTENPSDTPRRLIKPKAENYNHASTTLIRFLNGSLYSDKSLREEVPPAELIQIISNIFNDAFHTSLTSFESLILTNWDFDSIIRVIKKLRIRERIHELIVMILLSIVVEKKLYKDRGCKSESSFYKKYASVMGISGSKARDYSYRGIAFMKYRKDILEGVGCIPGIPLEVFVSKHMSKLTIYGLAVNKYGREKALDNLHVLSFREFQETVIKKVKPKKEGVTPRFKQRQSSLFKPPLTADEKQKAMILELNLSTSEKRLLHIIAKGGIVQVVPKLTPEQLELVENRIRQHRVELLEEGLRHAPVLFERKSYKPTAPFGFSSKPLAISDDIYELCYFEDIVLRIKEGLALVVPSRRIIAILMNRLYAYIDLRSRCLYPRPGVTYNSFEEFVREEFDMGAEYRDYIAIGKVILDHYYFLDHLTDIDTEDVFFKLKYLPNALRTHNSDEYLVLARLRSLTIREFKLFSMMSDFEITFSKKLNKKQLDLFDYHLQCGRNKEKVSHGSSGDYIELYSKDEVGMVLKIVDDVIKGTTTDSLSIPLQHENIVAPLELADLSKDTIEQSLAVA